MVKYDPIKVGDKDYIHAYSDSGRYLLGGVPYGEYTDANDPAEFGRTYIEGDVIPVDELEAQEILDIILGVTE